MNNKLINKIAKKIVATEVGDSFFRIMDKVSGVLGYAESST